MILPTYPAKIDSEPIEKQYKFVLKESSVTWKSLPPYLIKSSWHANAVTVKHRKSGFVNNPSKMLSFYETSSLTLNWLKICNRTKV
jgi:hypothetical protein